MDYKTGFRHIIGISCDLIGNPLLLCCFVWVDPRRTRVLQDFFHLIDASQGSFCNFGLPLSTRL